MDCKFGQTHLSDLTASGVFYYERNHEEKTKRRQSYDESRDYKVTSEHTYFIIDWDDTLLATSWLARNQINLETVFIPPKESAELEALDAAVSGFLRKVIYLYGNVLIVTNAQQGWVELSAKKFLPETYDLIFSQSSNSTCCSFSSSSSGFHNDNLESINFSVDFLEKSRSEKVVSTTSKNGTKKARLSTDMDLDGDIQLFGNVQTEQERADEALERISVFSARYLFEKDFPNDPSAWKRKAFQKLLKARISSDFFIYRPLTPIKSQSENLLLDLDETRSQVSRVSRRGGLERHNSSLSLGAIDLDKLVEVEEGSFEVETDFDENDSFFSFSFRPTPRDDSDIELEFEFDNPPPAEIAVTSTTSFEGNKEDRSTYTACNIISIGDCFHDCENLRTLELDLKDTFKKTVKLIEFPKISQVMKQLEELESHLDAIVKTKKNMDLVINKSYLL